MNTLRAFQGIDTAFDVTLSPSSVDFPTAPALAASVHRGDGGAAVATVSPVWSSTADDRVAVPMPGTVTADIEPGNYFLTVSIADGSAILSHDSLVIYPTPAGTTPLRTLVTPSELIGVIPEIQRDLTQLDAIPWLLQAATVACESYVGRKLAPTTFDEIDYGGVVGTARTMHLSSWPVTACRLRARPEAAMTIASPSGANSATVTVLPTSETDASIASLTLRRPGASDVVLTLADYATIADLAAAATLAGWVGTAAASYATWTPSELCAVNGPCTLGAASGARLYAFASELDGFLLDSQGGSVDLGGVAWSPSWDSRTAAGHLRYAVRRTYTAGYMPVPHDLRSACIMMALHIRESAKTAGPVQQQGMRDRYYTIAPTVDVPAPCRAILDRYLDDWAVC